MRQISPWVKAALEFGPLLVFFVAFRAFRHSPLVIGGHSYDGFVAATLVFVPVLVGATLALWALTGRLAAMQVVTLVLVLVFGGLTVWLDDPRFFKMKPTLIYLIFAGALGLALALRRNWLGLVLGQAVPLTEAGWRLLTGRLALFFMGLAVANEVIWRTQPDARWVLFKTFGLPLLMVAFFIANGRLFARHAPAADPGRDDQA